MASTVDNRIPVWLDCDPGHDVSPVCSVSGAVVGTGVVTHESDVGREGMHRKSEGERCTSRLVQFITAGGRYDASAGASVAASPPVRSGSAQSGSVRNARHSLFTHSSLSTSSSRHNVAVMR